MPVGVGMRRAQLFGMMVTACAASACASDVADDPNGASADGERRTLAADGAGEASVAAIAAAPPNPSIIVNHDLFVHTDRAIESGGQPASSWVSGVATPDASSAALGSISQNQAELAGLGAGFSLSATYGAHNLWYWKPRNGTDTYRQWLEGELGTQSNAYFAGGPIDVLILDKLLGRPDFLGEVLRRRTRSKPVFLSVRMNDHHHLPKADAFLSPNGALPITEAPFSRRVAALTPQYLDFLDEKKVISGDASPARGLLGDGLGCQRADEDGVGYHLDFADPNVLLQKGREVAALFAAYDGELEGVELDFLRSNCFFAAGTRDSLRTGRMRQLFDMVFQAKREFEVRTNRSILLTVRLPLDEVVATGQSVAVPIHGIDVSALAGNPAVNGIIFGYSKPYLHSQVPANPVPRRTGLSVYYELYQITDNQLLDTTGASQRRPATIDEVATAGYEALNAGYDGLSLFNFHYLFKSNPFVKPEYLTSKVFAWPRALSLLGDRERMKTSILPSYFFGERNADGVFKTDGSKPVSVTFRFARSGRRVEESAVLRILLEDFKPADKTAWDDVRFNVKVNGVLVTNASGAAMVPSTTTSWGRDPARYFTESHVEAWSPARSKVIQIPKAMFRDYTNKIEVIPVAETAILSPGRRLDLQLTM